MGNSCIVSLYKQVDGVAMGSPLGPTLANLFLTHLEQDWLKIKGAPVTYLRYVDDVSYVFDTYLIQDFFEFH